MSRSSLVISAILTVLGASTLYEVCVAAGIIELGSLPGEGPPGSVAIGLVAAAGMVAGAVAAEALAVSARPTPLAAFLAPCAAAFLVAHYYTFDAYYLPTSIRYSDRDFLPPAVVFVLAAAALVTGLTSYIRPRMGLALSGPVILACGLAAWFAGIGH
jgi:hypothetical protein